MTEVLTDVAAFRNACDRSRAAGQRVGLVPTMGALHAGHAALIEEACRRARWVAVSVFVNPTQFGPNEDYARYPRMLDHDVEVCSRAGAACVFSPAVSEMYPDGEATRVKVSGLSESLCGASRPGHFDGVTTVVAKLFAVTGSCVAVFGRKDYQQLKVVERMARDLLMPVEVVGHRIVREPDGVAMSSRNAYLTAAERGRARNIPLGLSAACRAFHEGERSVSVLRNLVVSQVGPAADAIDYVELADPDRLTLLDAAGTIGSRALLALAIRVGKARLIDNVVLGEDPAPCGGETEP